MLKASKENTNYCIQNTINHLPDDLKWLPHNMIAHPLMEILYQLGFQHLSEHIHSITTPKDELNDSTELE